MRNYLFISSNSLLYFCVYSYVTLNFLQLITMKKISIVLILLFIASISMEAQRSRVSERDRRNSRDDNELSDQLWYGISIGNLYFFNDFSASTKIQGGYKPIDRVSIGLQGKIYFDFINNIGQDFSLFSYGIGPEARIKISDDIYAIGEYNFMSLESARNNGTTIREGYNYPAAGLGYRQGRGPWTFGAQLLFIFSEDARSPAVLNRAVDYWIDFNYKF